MPESASGYVVDTNVLSNRSDVERDPVVIEWLMTYAPVIRVSVVAIAEMHRGLLLLEAKNASLTDHRVKIREEARLARKRSWYDSVIDRFADRMEPIDPKVAMKWAEVSVRFPSLRDADKAIAATALVKGYGVASENLGDFRNLGLSLMNPFEPATWIDPPDLDPVTALLRR